MIHDYTSQIRCIKCDRLLAKSNDDKLNLVIIAALTSSLQSFLELLAYESYRGDPLVYLRH